jgi:hypothetical protein
MNTHAILANRLFVLMITISLAELFLLGDVLCPSFAQTSKSQELSAKKREPKAYGERPPNFVFGQKPDGTQPYRFLIPEGYVGWVRVDFDVVGASELPIEDGYYVFKFPKSGRLQTSSSDLIESRRNQFFYYSDKGRYLIKAGGPVDTRLVQEEFSGPGPGHLPPVPNRYRYIFIGPTTAFESQRAIDTKLRPKELDGYPRVGAQTWLTEEDLEKIIPKQP